MVMNSTVESCCMVLTKSHMSYAKLRTTHSRSTATLPRATFRASAIWSPLGRDNSSRSTNRSQANNSSSNSSRESDDKAERE